MGVVGRLRRSSEIAQELGIAKGSVVNIIDEFRNGEMEIAPNEYIDVLRELAVDLKLKDSGDEAR